MRILFCNFEYPPLGGGGGVINALLAQELAKSHDVTVLTSKGIDTPEENVEEGVKVVRVPVFFRRELAVANVSSMAAFVGMGVRKGLQLLRQNNFDVINTHFVLPTGPVGEMLSRAGRVPNILSLHGGDLYDPSKKLSPHRYLATRMCVKSLLRRAHVVVGQSRNTLENMRMYYTPEIKGVRIPLAIKRPHIVSVSRAQYGFGENDVLLITVGRLIARKAIPQLIHMMEHFRHDNVRLLILGEGPEEEALKAEIAQRKLQSHIHLLGFVSETEKLSLLNMSDMYVSTSQHEGFGLVFLEGMACGLPVVSYDNGGQTDFLEDAKTGYLVPLNDLDLFTQRCRTLVADVGLRKAMGEYNRHIMENYFIDSCAARYEDAFEMAIDMKGVGQRTWFYSLRPNIWRSS